MGEAFRGLCWRSRFQKGLPRNNREVERNFQRFGCAGASLHWEEWKDTHETLGQIPYVKGALFLVRLRADLGDEIFWRGIGLYASGNARRLVDSRDFERVMEKARGRDLKGLFDEAVYR